MLKLNQMKLTHDSGAFLALWALARNGSGIGPILQLPLSAWSRQFLYTVL